MGRNAASKVTIYDCILRVPSRLEKKIFLVENQAEAPKRIFPMSGCSIFIGLEIMLCDYASATGTAQESIPGKSLGH